MPMNDLQGLLADPHLAATGFFRTVEHPSEGTIRDMRVAATWSVTQPAPSRLAPRLGEQGAEILREAGFDDARIRELIEGGVVRPPDIQH